MKKKRLKKLHIILLLVSLLIISVVGSIILNKTYKIQYNSLDKTDKEMLIELSAICKNFNHNVDSLWNKDYKLSEKPIIFIRSSKSNGLIRKQAYAINVKSIENSIFSKKIDIPSSMGLPPVYRISKFDLSTISTWMPINFGNIKISNEDVFYFKYYPKMMENPDLYYDFSSFLLHESFHTYKQKDWIYDKNEGEYIKDYPVNKENYALMGLGFSLLDKCMESNDINQVKNYLKEWTVVQTYRYKKWPQLQNESNTEAIEGTARYLEYKYSLLTGKHLMVLAKKEEPYHVTFMQAFEFIANNQAESRTYLERPMKYETGAALGLIMDKLNIIWKPEIEDSKNKRGKTQYEILKKHFNINDTDIVEDKLMDIKNNNDYNSLLILGEKIVNLTK